MLVEILRHEGASSDAGPREGGRKVHGFHERVRERGVELHCRNNMEGGVCVWGGGGEAENKIFSNKSEKTLKYQ